MNNKGFTLIEILAIIVIMGLVMAITIPNVFNTIESSRMETTRMDGEGILRVFENQVYSLDIKQLESAGTYTIKDGIIEEDNNFKYNIKNTYSGKLEVSEDKKISLSINNNKYCLYKDFDDTNIKIEVYPSLNCSSTIPVYDPCFGFDQITGTIYSYGPQSEITYKINETICQTSLMNLFAGLRSGEASSICNGGSVFKDDFPISIRSIISVNNKTFNDNLISSGIITEYTKSENTNTCPTDVVIPNKINLFPVKSIGKSAFANKSLTSVIIPEGVIRIGNNAFEYNNLTTLTLPNSITSMGTYAFQTNFLSSVKLSDNLNNIDDFTFYNNEILTLTIPASVMSIGISAFDSNGFTDLTIPGTVKIIEDFAFGWSGIDNLTFEEGIIEIGAEAFISNNISSINIPSTVKILGGGSFNYNFVSGPQAFIYGLNVDGTINTEKLNSYAGRPSGNLIIPEGIKILENDSLYRLNLTSVTFPSTLTTIGKEALRRNSLTTVTIPSTVTSIGPKAFSLNNLSTVTFAPGSLITSGMIDYEVFQKNSTSNINLNKIIYTGTSTQDWNRIINTISGTPFIIGTVTNALGNVTISAN